MKLFRNTVFLAMSVLCLTMLSACAPKMDCSSKESMEQSISEMRESLQPEAQAKFDEAINNAVKQNSMGILAAGIADAIVHKGDEENKGDEVIKQVCGVLEGKTAAQIINEYGTK